MSGSHLATTCWACGGSDLEPFHSVGSIPTQSCCLVDTEAEAAAWPRGSLTLAVCLDCGFVENTEFDPSLVDYSVPTEESQAYSPTFRAFSDALARELHDRLDLADASVLEVGCGKGDFLVSLAELGVRSAVGIDPGFLPDRAPQGDPDRAPQGDPDRAPHGDPDCAPDGDVRFIRDHYDEDHRDLSADVVITRHLLEHLSSLRSTGALLVDAIEPGGAMFTELPDAGRVLDELAFWDVYYEHCAYWTLGSLGRYLRSLGLRQDEVRLGFGDQYLLAWSRPGPSDEPHPTEEPVAETIARARRFGQEATASVARWRDQVTSARDAGRRVAIWGGGSKAVGFLSGIGASVDAVVDINPHKQGKWLAGTDARVEAPSVLTETGVDLVVVMNPIYVEEITADLGSMGLSPEVVAV